MRLKQFLLLLAGLFYISCSFAQTKSEYTQSRILILLDRSSSMIQEWSGGRSKSKAADELILKLMDSVYAINPDVEFSLRVFGHQYTVPQNNCQDTKNEVPFAKDNRIRMSYRLDDIKPLGVTSIAYSLAQAAEYDLVDEVHNAYSILLITDGGESCGGDICGVMQKLINNKIYFKPYIISLEDYAPLKSTYACMGDYLQVLKESDMQPAIGVIVNAFRPILKIKAADYKELQTIAANVPSVLKVNVPVMPATPPPVKPDPVTVPPAVKKPAPIDALRIAPTNAKLLVAGPKAAQRMPVVKVPGFEPVKIDEPAPAVAEAPPARPAPEKISGLAPIKLQPRAINLPTASAMHMVAPPAFEPIAIVEEPEKPVAVKIGYAAPSRLKPVPNDVPKNNYRPAAVTAPRLSALIIDTPVAVVPPAPPRVADKISRMKPALKKLGIMFAVEEHSFRLHQVPPLPPFKYDMPVAAIAVKGPKPKPVVMARPPEGKTAEYTMERPDDKETTVEIYFTNGKGKFYTTTPQIVMLDAVTGNLIKRFYRTVDANDNPDPQKGVPPGIYNVMLSETRGTVVRNAEIVEHKRNKIIVKVSPASLSFEYADAINRPIKEFEATVIERNKPSGRIQKQKCTEKMEYDPGNYHVIINTFPQEVRNLDLDFDEHVIKIAQPGFAKFVAPGLNSIVLYQRLGDKFLAFNTIDLNAASSQPLRIQPGEYQAHYRKGPGGPSASEKVVTFIIKATMVAVIELN